LALVGVYGRGITANPDFDLGIAARIMRQLFVLLLASLTLSGCALFNNPADNPDKWSAEKYYAEAKKALKAEDYKLAVERFEGLISHHPFGLYAQQAQLDIAYAYYKYDEADSAIAAADQFIKLYPRHDRVDYAYYIKGLARFPKSDYLERLFNLDMAQRDPRALRESFQFFAELTQRFPDSPYAADARQRMIYLRNALARNEIYAAEFYMQKQAYAAAANRAKYVVEHYDRTPSIPAALSLMAKAYDNLGMPKLAEDARRVLQLNFPNLAHQKSVLN
jgi:outer membrane protein assembly factor BamD